MGERVRRVVGELRARLRGMPGRSARRGVEESLWPNALAAGSAVATGATLLILMASITLDDLHLFRLPLVYVGSGAAVLVFAFAPPVLAFRLLERVAVDAPDRRAQVVEAMLIRRRAFFAASLGAFLVWLVFFSAGRTVVW